VQEASLLDLGFDVAAGHRPLLAQPGRLDAIQQPVAVDDGIVVEVERPRRERPPTPGQQVWHAARRVHTGARADDEMMSSARWSRAG